MIFEYMFCSNSNLLSRNVYVFVLHTKEDEGRENCELFKAYTQQNNDEKGFFLKIWSENTKKKRKQSCT